MTTLEDRKRPEEGFGDQYHPYYQIQDRTTRKSSDRIPSLTGGRSVHVVGNEETATYYLYAWSRNVYDINEQYPLQLERTLAIAADCGLHHPMKNRKPRVITCTFRICYSRRGQHQFAFRTVMKLSSIRTSLAELELLHQYYKHQEADWGVITEEEIPWTKARNIEYYYGLRNINDQMRFPDVIQTRHREIEQSMLRHAAEKERTIDSLVAIVATELDLSRSTLIDFCGHLIFNRILVVDMNKKISNNKTIVRPNASFGE